MNVRFHGRPLVGRVAQHDNRVVEANFSVHHAAVGIRKSPNLDRIENSDQKINSRPGICDD
jgi:hypothetical protein